MGGLGGFVGLVFFFFQMPPLPTAVTTGNLMGFLDFWQQYPRKIAKKDAERAWLRLSVEQQSAAMTALPMHCKHWQLRGDLQFVPHPATWLNGERWEDELPSLEQSAGRQVAWWSTDEATMAKGRELGVSARPGEDMKDYRARLRDRMIAR